MWCVGLWSDAGCGTVEIAVLRHQLVVLHRQVPRPRQPGTAASEPGRATTTSDAAGELPERVPGHQKCGVRALPFVTTLDERDEMPNKKRTLAALTAIAVLTSLMIASPASATGTLYPCVGAPGVYGAIGDHYFYTPGIRQALGCPTGWETAGLGADRVQYFQGGLIYWWSPVTNVRWQGAYATWGDIYVRYRGCNGIYGPLGPPVTDEQMVLVFSDWRISNFLNGDIQWFASNRSTTVHDAWGNNPGC